MYGPLRPWACLSRWHPRSSYEGLRSKLSSLHDAMRSIFIATRCTRETRFRVSGLSGLHELFEFFLRREGAHGAVAGAGEGACGAAPQGRLAHPVFFEGFVREVYEGGGEESVSGAGGVHDLTDVEGGHLTAVLPGGVECAFRPLAYEHQGDAAVQKHTGGLFDVIGAEQRRELVVAQLDDGGEVKERVHGLLGGLGALPEVLAEVDVEGDGDAELACELRDAVRRRANGLADQGDAAEVHERRPGEQPLRNVLGREQFVCGRAGTVEGELAVTVGTYLHKGERGAGRWALATDTGGIHALGLERPQDEVSEEILANAADEGGLGAQAGSGHCYVRRRPPWPGDEPKFDRGDILFPVDVRDDLAQRDYLLQVFLRNLYLVLHLAQNPHLLV